MVADGSRRVVVTGANEGIGHHMARALLENGHRVAVLDIDTEHCCPLAERYGDRLVFRECDVTTDADVCAKLARKTESAGPVVTADWQQRSDCGLPVGSRPSSGEEPSGSWGPMEPRPRAASDE